jgi:3-dehydroquinate synthase
VITDSNIEPLHAPGILALAVAGCGRADLIAFPAGESSKSRATKERIEDRMLELGCGRDTAVVAFGGGVTGDLAGFVAATFMRGLPWIQVPTSLIAMADASIGGKTGVDHPRGKNLIGAFHHPAGVLSDTDFLATLPEAELRGGLAEIVKAAVVGDAALFGLLERKAADPGSGRPGAIDEPLRRAVQVKGAIVSDDAGEAGKRKILNFGHTVGHALERVSGYALPHGPAVSIGMVAEARLSLRMGLLDSDDCVRIERLLEALGLPTRIPPALTSTALIEAAGTDKKALAGRLHLALPCGIGRMAQSDQGWSHPVPRSLLDEILREMGASPAGR